MAGSISFRNWHCAAPTRERTLREHAVDVAVRALLRVVAVDVRYLCALRVQAPCRGIGTALEAMRATGSNTCGQIQSSNVFAYSQSTDRYTRPC
jgi:hypothetical protein